MWASWSTLCATNGSVWAILIVTVFRSTVPAAAAATMFCGLSPGHRQPRGDLMSLPDTRRAPWWRLAAFGAEPSGDRLTRIQRSPQYVAGELRNSLPTSVVKPGANLRVTRAQLTGWRRRKPGFAVPVHQVAAADFAPDAAPGLRLTWLGHATVLAELDERRVLFDPVWSFRCSPFAFAGPSRCHPVPLPLEDVPPLDVVAISHDHYDHLDMQTVRVLARTTPATFVVPLGVGAHLEHWGTFNIAPQPWAEPIERTIAAAQESGTSLLTPRVGQPVAPAEAVRGLPANPWWRPEPSHGDLVPVR